MIVESQVYEDPIRKAQEEMLKELLVMREGLAQSIDEACKAGPGAAVSVQNPGSGQVVSQEDYKKAMADNKKLRYRVAHLLRALGEGEGVSESTASSDFKLIVIDRTNQTLTNLCEVTARVCGYNLEIVQIDGDI